MREISLCLLIANKRERTAPNGVPAFPLRLAVFTKGEAPKISGEAPKISNVLISNVTTPNLEESRDLLRPVGSLFAFLDDVLLARAQNDPWLLVTDQVDRTFLGVVWTHFSTDTINVAFHVGYCCLLIAVDRQYCSSFLARLSSPGHHHFHALPSVSNEMGTET